RNIRIKVCYEPGVQRISIYIYKRKTGLIIIGKTTWFYTQNTGVISGDFAALILRKIHESYFRY
ncbi:MAG: hypothetical protein C5B59_03295, partial [Bacteroidetes bacterium]